MKEKIKVGFCVAYDWHLLEYALPQIYSHADLICLSLDVDRISWSGNKYKLDEQRFTELVRRIDIDQKIMIVEEDYHLPSLTPMQNEVRQRNFIAKHMGSGGWHIQLDCDEYFVDFNGFVNYLQSLPQRSIRKANVCCPWVVLFKEVKNGFLYVDPRCAENIEFMQIATQEPHYEYGRRNGNFNLYTNFQLIHQSWARPSAEIEEKIYNWGHSHDFHKEQYFQFWSSLSETNFDTAINFHWLKPEIWPSLKLIQVSSVHDLVTHPQKISFPSLSTTELRFKNSRLFSKLKKLLNLLLGNSRKA